MMSAESIDTLMKRLQKVSDEFTEESDDINSISVYYRWRLFSQFTNERKDKDFSFVSRTAKSCDGTRKFFVRAVSAYLIGRSEVVAT